MTEQKRTYKSYTKLLQRLGRSGFKYPGKIATVLLEIYVWKNGKLRKDFFPKIVFNHYKNYSEFRDELIKKGYLIKVDNKYSDIPEFDTGKKLFGYVNDEKLKHKEIATKDELRETSVESKLRYDSLDIRMKKLESALKVMIEEFDPPYSDNKLESKLKSI